MEPLNSLFVYGIFLSRAMRKAYGMSNPNYSTVADYATFGRDIVQAVHIPKQGLGLTGLVVEVDPARWEDIDRLEDGYDRVKVKTNADKEVWMYAAKTN